MKKKYWFFSLFWTFSFLVSSHPFYLHHEGHWIKLHPKLTPKGEFLIPLPLDLNNQLPFLKGQWGPLLANRGGGSSSLAVPIPPGGFDPEFDLFEGLIQEEENLTKEKVSLVVSGFDLNIKLADIYPLGGPAPSSNWLDWSVPECDFPTPRDLERVQTVVYFPPSSAHFNLFPGGDEFIQKENEFLSGCWEAGVDLLIITNGGGSFAERGEFFNVSLSFFEGEFHLKNSRSHSEAPFSRGIFHKLPKKNSLYHFVSPGRGEREERFFSPILLFGNPHKGNKILFLGVNPFEAPVNQKGRTLWRKMIWLLKGSPTLWQEFILNGPGEDHKNRNFLVDLLALSKGMIWREKGPSKGIAIGEVLDPLFP